jgi:hypothetical protein
MNVISINNIDHLQVQQATCELKMTKFGWNVVKLDNSCNVGGRWGRQDFFLCVLQFLTTIESNLVGVIVLGLQILMNDPSMNLMYPWKWGVYIVPNLVCSLKICHLISFVITLTLDSRLSVECKGPWSQNNVFGCETHSHKWWKMQVMEHNNSQVHSHFGS